MDTEFEWPDEAGPHPLLIPAVIEKVLKKQSYKDLKNCRCVCLAWEEIGSLYLRQKAIIRFSCDAHVKNYLIELSKNYSCVSYEFGSEVHLKSSWMMKFYWCYGNHVTSLKLHHIDWSGMQLFEILFNHLTKLEELSIRFEIPKVGHIFEDDKESENRKLPNLKILNLSFVINKSRHRRLRNPPILQELLESTPNLETMFCLNWPALNSSLYPSANVSNLVFKVMFSNPLIQLRKLSNLNIHASLSDFELNQLREKKFPLKELKLDILHSTTLLCLFSLLESLKTTLIKLVLSFPWEYDYSWMDEFPLLSNVKNLSLHNYEGPIDFIDHSLPSLKILLLNDVFLSGKVDGQPRHHKLEQLIQEGRNFAPIAFAQKITIYFPYLKKIKLHCVNDTVLRVIFRSLQHLEELTAQGDFTDFGVTGITKNKEFTLQSTKDINGSGAQKIFYHIN